MLVPSIAGGAKASNDDFCEAEVGANGVYGANGRGGAAAEVGEVDVEVCVGEPVRDCCLSLSMRSLLPACLRKSLSVRSPAR
jgi:hypothetical protein